jgi:hypothetical protein
LHCAASLRAFSDVAHAETCLAAHFGIGDEIPPLKVIPDKAEIEKAGSAFTASKGNLRLAVHISARRPPQRWPAERFAH